MEDDQEVKALLTKAGNIIFMKRRFVIIALTIALVLVSGCGKSEGSATGNAAKTVETTEVTGNENGELNSGGTEDTTSKEVTDDAEAVAVDEITTAEESAREDLHLKDIYAEYGINVGTCLSPDMIKNTKFSDIITSQFNSVTMENAMKPENILNRKKSAESGELTVAFGSDAIKMLNWAKDNNMAVRGHTLVWYSQTPKWIFCKDFDSNNEFVSREEMLVRMESMIKQTFAQLEDLGYSDMFYAYDIVNEAWMDDGVIRKENNPWYEIIGDDYLWYAFYYADMYAPESIKLFYNDYNEQYKSKALVRFIETLVDEDGNYLIDGIGLQAHLYTMDDLDKYLKAVKELGATGLTLELTELDVCLGSYNNMQEASDDNLKIQGKFYYSLLNGILDMVKSGDVKLDAITFWGFSDAFSWRREGSPLIYDGLCKPKYAFYGAAGMKDYAGF